MIHWTNEDAKMLAHVVDVMNERIAVEGGYEEEGKDTMVKLEELAKAGAAVTVTGEQQGDEARQALFTDIVNAELDNWIPNASQRLLFRAGAALGIAQAGPFYALTADCGPALGDHATFPDRVAGVYVRRCANCARIYRA